MKKIVVILAAGSGKRVGEGLPKQWISVHGKPIVEYTITAFHAHPQIDEIAIVLSSDYVGKLGDYIDLEQYPKIKAQIEGGKERYESTLAALNYYKDEAEAHILFHDAARPLISTEVISRVLSALQDYQAVLTAIPSADTVVEVNLNQEVAHYPERSIIFRAQTPQGFHISVIREAFRLALLDSQKQITDDCSLVHYYLPHIPVKVVEGASENFKITYPEDIVFFEDYITKQANQ